MMSNDSHRVKIRFTPLSNRRVGKVVGTVGRYLKLQK